MNGNFKIVLGWFVYGSRILKNVSDSQKKKKRLGSNMEKFVRSGYGCFYVNFFPL